MSNLDLAMSKFLVGVQRANDGSLKHTVSSRAAKPYVEHCAHGMIHIDGQMQKVSMQDSWVLAADVNTVDSLVEAQAEKMHLRSSNVYVIKTYQSTEVKQHE